MELAGAVPGYRTFDLVCADADTFNYAIRLGSDWEIGDGTYNASANSITRNTVIASSNNDLLVPFDVGSKEVFIADSAKRMVWKTGTLTSGRIPFANSDGDLIDASEWQWDDANKRIVYTVTDAATTTASTVFTISHNSSGTPGIGFGSQFLFRLESATVVDRDAASIVVAWSSATDATRRSKLSMWVTSDGTLVEAVRYSGLNSSTLTAQIFGTTAISPGDLSVTYESTATNAVRTVLYVTNNCTSGTSAGFGVAALFLGETSTTANTEMAKIATEFVDATHASFRCDLYFNVYDATTAREGLRIRSSGSAAQIGFLGATPVSRQGNTTDLKDVLVNFGLLTDGGATPLNLDSGTLTAGAIVGTMGTYSDAISITISTAVTNSKRNALVIEHNSSGTPATNFGVAIEAQLESSTTTDREAGQLYWAWATATDASRASYSSWTVYSTSTEQEGIRIQANSGGVQLGFYAATPISKPSSTGETTGTTAGAGAAFRVDGTITGNVGSTAYTLGDIVKHLKNLGLLTT